MKTPEVIMSEQHALKLYKSVQDTRKWASIMAKLDSFHAMTYPNPPALSTELAVLFAISGITNPFDLLHKNDLKIFQKRADLIGKLYPNKSVLKTGMAVAEGLGLTEDEQRGSAQYFLGAVKAKIIADQYNPMLEKPIGTDEDNKRFDIQQDDEIRYFAVDMEDMHGLSYDQTQEYLNAVRRFGNRMGEHLSARTFNPRDFLAERQYLAGVVLDNRYTDFNQRGPSLALPISSFRV